LAGVTSVFQGGPFGGNGDDRRVRIPGRDGVAGENTNQGSGPSRFGESAANSPSAHTLKTGGLSCRIARTVTKKSDVKVGRAERRGRAMSPDADRLTSVSAPPQCALRPWADGGVDTDTPGDPDMMLNLIDALGTFENPVGQLVMIMAIAALAAVRDSVLPAHPGDRPGPNE
jgi:hypothetical protein